jgi:hypothetical protein
MDRVQIFQALGLVPGGEFAVTDIQMVQWGRDLILECVYQTMVPDAPADAPVVFRIVFLGCREIRYKVYAHISAHESGTVNNISEIAEIVLGSSNHRRDARILTKHFSITISYRDIRFEKDSEFYYLGDA